MATKLRVLFFDIETAPALVYAWRANQDYIPAEMVVRDTSMLMWAAKWRGEPKMFSDRVTEVEAVGGNDLALVSSLAKLVREADIVVGHNVEQFDIPMLNNRVMLLGEEPLGPVKMIDTLRLARKNFRLMHNKLDYLAKQLGLGGKLKTDFELWRSIIEDGNETSIKRMLRYNKRDVVLLEQVFEKMLPYVNGIPRLVDPEVDGEFGCPYCPSLSLQKRGIKRTNGLNYQQWQCNKCLRYSRTRVNMGKKLGLMTV